MDLVGTSFDRANLGNAQVQHAKLSYAQLNSTNLNGASFVNADLGGAGLSNARLRLTDLRFASLTGANLSFTNFVRTSLSQANVTSATCWSTIFVNVDLSDVEGLAKITHFGPSSVDVDTLYKSGGKIPRVFLEGCGVPADLIDYLPSLIGAQDAIQYYSVFISYATADEAFCKRLHSRLRDEKLRVWFAPEDLEGGKKLHPQIMDAIQVHDRLLVVLSPNSMDSDWVRQEISAARDRERREGRQILFPIRLCGFEAIETWRCLDPRSGQDLGGEVREYFVPDFSNWKDHDNFESAFAKLLAALRAQERRDAEARG